MVKQPILPHLNQIPIVILLSIVRGRSLKMQEPRLICRFIWPRPPNLIRDDAGRRETWAANEENSTKRIAIQRQTFVLSVPGNKISHEGFQLESALQAQSQIQQVHQCSQSCQHAFPNWASVQAELIVSGLQRSQQKSVRAQRLLCTLKWIKANMQIHLLSTEHIFVSASETVFCSGKMYLFIYCIYLLNDGVTVSYWWKCIITIWPSCSEANIFVALAIIRVAHPCSITRCDWPLGRPGDVHSLQDTWINIGQ